MSYLKNIMLHFFRQKSESLFIKILMLLLAATFILWGVGGMIRDGKGEDYAFKVGNKEFSAQAWHTIAKTYIDNIKHQNGGTISEEIVSQIKREIFDILVKRSILLQESQRLNLLVSDTMVQYSIASKPEFLNQDKKFDQNKFQEYLKLINSSEDTYVANLKEDIAINLLIQPLNNINIAPKSIVSYLSNLRNLVRRFDLIEIDTTKVTSQSQPNEADLQATLNANEKQFSTPEIREVKYFSFSAKDVDQTVNISDDELESYYKSKTFLFTEGEKRRISHLLLSSQEEASAAKKELSNGTEIKSVALKYKAKNSQVDLGFLDSTAFDKQFKEAIFNLKDGEITQPLHSPLGYHLFKVTAITPSKTKLFEEVKNTIKKQISDEKIFERLSDLSQSIDIDIAADVSIEDIAKKNDLKVHKSVTSSDVNIKDDQIVNAEVFKTTAANTEVNNSSMVTQLNNNTFFVLKVEHITPSKLKSLDEIRFQVTDLWRKNQSLDKLKELSKTVIQDLKDSKLLTDKSIIMTKIDLSHKNFHQYDRKLVSELASLKIGNVTPLINIDSKYYIAKFTAVSLEEDGSSFESEIKKHYQDINPELLVDQYINVISKSYPVKINSSIMNQ